MSVLDQACSLIAGFEGLRLKPYLDSAGIPTIGYGSTYYEDDTVVTMKDPAITENRAMSLLSLVVSKCLDTVQNLVTVDLTDNQLCALTSFTYNEGAGAFSRSTMLVLLNQGQYQQAADEFLKWTRAGRDPQRLLARREKEREVFLS